MVVHTFYPSTWEAQEGGSLTSRPTWSTEQVLGQQQKQINPVCVWGGEILWDNLFVHYKDVTLPFNKELNGQLLGRRE